MNKIKIYKHDIVRQIQLHYGDLLFLPEKGIKIKKHLSWLADKLYEGIKEKNVALYSELNNYNLDFIGKSVEKIAKLQISKEDCFRTISREHGFDSISNIDDDLGYNSYFEKAVNHMLQGNLKQLKSLLDIYPSLINQRSQYGHEASLLLYAANNGVEFWRQQVPMNLPEILNTLILRGADIDATMNIYGGTYNSYELMSTSAHPFKAGIAEEVLAILNTNEQ